MTDTLSTHAAPLPPSDVDALRERFAGPLITPDDPAYEAARHVWNASIDRRPALIARCTGVADVIAAVRFGREHDLVVAVRCGSHGVAGNGTCDGGIVIDLSPMKGVRVDPAGRRVHGQGGLVWKDLDRETQAFGLAVTGGLISSTGVGGFTLGGGVGWLHRSLGLAIDNLVSVDLVTADGEFVHANDETQPELMWGLRGGGGNFGIATSFEFALHPVGPQVLAGLIIHRGEDAAEVLRAYRDFMADAPDAIGLNAVLRIAPPAPFVPEEAHGKRVLIVLGMHAGPLDRAEEELRPMREIGNPVADLFMPRQYTMFQSMLDAAAGPGLRNYWKAEYVSGLPDAAIDALVEGLQGIVSPMSDIKIPALRGAVARVGEEDTAYGHREAPFVVNVNARWESPADDEREIAWTRGVWESMAPYSHGGAYVNFMGEEGPERVRAAYGAAKYDRLVALKDRWDPQNVFRLNQNIRPSAQQAGT